MVAWESFYVLNGQIEVRRLVVQSSTTAVAMDSSYISYIYLIPGIYTEKRHERSLWLPAAQADFQPCSWY